MKSWYCEPCAVEVYERRCPHCGGGDARCTCIRCKAKELVRSIYPKMHDRRVLMVATKIAKALRSSVAESACDRDSQP